MEQVRVRTVLMRGGSSKAVFLREGDVPADRDARTRFLLALLGSPDKRQIDGLGGSDLLTSKCAIMGPPSRPDADIDYTFAQVSVEHPIVSYDINCGNISSAAGLFAIEEGFVRAVAPRTTVRVHNTNTGKVLHVKVPVADGAPVIEGPLRIDGVPGTGAEIQIDFSQTAGAATGRLLPTGRVRDRMEVPGLAGAIEVSLVDVANPCVFVRAADVGLEGTEWPGTVPEAAFDLLESIRMQAAALAGIDSVLLPFQVIVAPPASSREYLTERHIRADEVDLHARLFVERVMHKAYAATGATCLGVAARIAGTVAHEACRPRSVHAPIRIGHPSGVMPVVADVSQDRGSWRVNEVLLSRTARRLMEGYAFVRSARL